ncbi:MAG TPA: glycosyltransferase family 2 protein [Bryobacteraceae bacterium]|nr:glycosyltransferase family 2 protein [Bryobacteraceae bacterium]
MTHSPVAVTIVTYNSEWYIRPCLESVLALDPAPEEIVVIDNLSSDGTRTVLREFSDWVKVVCNGANTGFAAGQNQAIALTRADWVLTLNPDVILPPDFLGRLLESGEVGEDMGTLCGKMLSLMPDMTLQTPPLLDSTGIYFTPQLRHFDRGWGEPDNGQYNQREEVFGASAAAALYRRRMIEAVQVEGNFFDPAFFAYREDADVAWRAQLLGWRCEYRPAAHGFHVRQVRPGKRGRNPKLVNMHSVKNRFLMRAKNITWPVWKQCWASTLARDATVVAGCLLHEHDSLPAFWHFVKAMPAALRQRREIMARQSDRAAQIVEWFQFPRPETPAAKRKNFPAAVVDPPAHRS